MSTEFSFDVFLSYNSADKPRVRRLAERLRTAGVRVWFDEWVIKPGEDIYLAIERGLEAARTLVLCLSPAALGSNWVGLERSTVLYRDPSNAGRRFIPLLLAQCDLPDTLRRYRYVDFREESDESFTELLAACRPIAEVGAPPPRRAMRKRVAPRAAPRSGGTGAELEWTLDGHTGPVSSVAISPDGRWAASASNRENRVVIWDLQNGKILHILEEHSEEVRCVAITPDGRRLLSGANDKTIRVWDTVSWKTLRVLDEHTARVLDIDPLGDSERIFVCSGNSAADSELRLWNIESGECLRLITPGHRGFVNSVAITHDGFPAISGSQGWSLKVWDLDTGRCLATLEHSSPVDSVQLSPDGRHAVSASPDPTIKIWDLQRQVCVATLEGHEGWVESVALSPDGRLIASTGSTDQTLRLWDFRSGACLQIIESENHASPVCTAFSPDGTRLVAGTYESTIYVYRLISGTLARPAEQTRRYVNAKVVLVGESGVGKSALAHRMIEDQFIPTRSTHGMQVWRLDLPLEPDEGIEREALLWDLAGQEDYRLIHQLFLDETALALLLFNPQEDDPFAELGVWLKVLRTAVPDDRARDVAKLLIAARMDVGGVKVSQQKIDRFLKANGVAAYLPTSALRGDNCSDTQAGGKASSLKELIAQHIRWDELPWTSTPRLLDSLKNALIALTEQRNIRLLRFAELAQRLEQALPGESFGESDLRTAVTLLANHGLVLPLKFGDLVLLRPELLNGYAAAVIRAARDHTDEIGCVKEQSVFDRIIDLEGVDRLEPADEELLMRALVQTLLTRSLCIAEDTPEGRHLVFPSQYRQERPIPSHPEIFVSYSFSGEWQTVYTTLVVRLWYSREFQHRELWRNAAEFATSKGRTVGLLMERTREGEGTISVFFDIGVPDELKVIFIEYVHRHLEKHVREVYRDRRYVCQACAKPVTDLDAVRERFASKKDFIYCQKCDEKVPLIDHIEQRLASDPVARRVLGMDERATRELDAQALEQILTGHMMAICGEANQIFRELTKFDVGIDGEVEFKDNNGSASGRKIYVQLKSGASYLRTRQADGKEIFDVKNPRHLEYWVSQPVDVFLVIRDVEETIRWMNVTRHLKARTEKQSRQIVFEGEKLDATAIWRVRDQFFK